MAAPYVPDDRLARFRALDERAMPDTCSITRTSPGVQNPDGSFEDGTTVILAGKDGVVDGRAVDGCAQDGSILGADSV